MFIEDFDIMVTPVLPNRDEDIPVPQWRAGQVHCGRGGMLHVDRLSTNER